MLRIKICGITSVEDARMAAEAGADAIGLNFHAQSPRYVTPERAKQIAEATRQGPHKFGVFVNAGVGQIVRMVRDVPLDGIQLHGDETPEFIHDLRAKLPVTTRPSATSADALDLVQCCVLKAFRCADSDLAVVVEFLRICRGYGSLPDAVLVDSHVPGEYGGTGTTCNWSQIGQQRELLGNLPLFLAGGLTPENVAQAIKQCQPDWLDVASGVESEPGVKDPEKVKQFVAMAAIGRT
ncbi:MAG: phosphoribosylanthranilate isomerase [Planctomycetaceae bacterium]|nr:phosphoribosylanthranilate isomerase [Planctomycetaceae bacterium]